MNKKKGEHILTKEKEGAEERLSRRGEQAGWTVHLYEPLTAMQEALEQAIADAKRGKAPAQEACDGRLLSITGESLTYEFQLKTEWDVSDGTSIIALCGERLIDARVVSQADRVLTLATQDAIPDLKSIALKEDASWLLSQLLKALLYLEETDGQMGAKVLGLLKAVSGMEAMTEHLGTFVPSVAQQRAIEHGLGSERTLIIGPGGTGKTATLSDLMCRYLLQGLSVLLVSHTNIATDNAFICLVQAMQASGKTELLRLLEMGLVVRQGDPRHEALQTGAYRGLTVAAIAEARQASTRERLEQRYDDLYEQVEQNEARLEECEAAWPSRQAELEKQVRVLSSQLAEQVRLRSERQDALKSLQAQERQLRRHCQTHRESQEQYRQAWQAATEELKDVRSMGWLKRILFKWGYDEQAAVSQIEQLSQSWAAEGKRIAAIDAKLGANQAGQRKYQDEERVHLAAIEQCKRDLASLQAELKQEEQAITALNDLVADQQEQLGHLSRCLAGMDEEQKEIRAQIVDEARLVATTATGVFVNPRLFQQEFDVVVVDELSMISVILVLLVASRAKLHFVGGGDPMQLSPVVKLANKAKAPLAQEWLSKDLFTYLGITISEATSGEKDCVFLDEQGRMHPAIAAPISQLVYLGMLLNRAETYDFPSCDPFSESAIVLMDSSFCGARCIKPSEDKPRENAVHAQIVVMLVRQIVQNGTGSIGVITPYRSQVKLISQALREANLLDRVHVGTIHTVQGLQFDVVIFDTVEAPGTNPWPFTCDAVFDKHQMATAATRLLNVAHTRARYKLIYVAHMQHLHDHARRCGEHWLLLDLLDWASRACHVRVKRSTEPGGSFSFEQ